jgi:pimeloyl-ACP methyl ester carboxylesterase
LDGRRGCRCALVGRAVLHPGSQSRGRRGADCGRSTPRAHPRSRPHRGAGRTHAPELSSVVAAWSCFHRGARWPTLPMRRSAAALAGPLARRHERHLLPGARSRGKGRCRTHFALRPPPILQSMVHVTLGQPCEKLSASASDITCPVLFLHGEDDALVPPRCARSIHERLMAAGPFRGRDAGSWLGHPELPRWVVRLKGREEQESSHSSSIVFHHTSSLKNKPISPTT